MWSILIGIAIFLLAVIILKKQLKGESSSCSSCASCPSCSTCMSYRVQKNKANEDAN
ncbi:MAG: hypothetical protein Q4E07_02020 [Eubacteriales bacterium]|nr:hypothetical protein [Eubacteriales bacterium]